MAVSKVQLSAHSYRPQLSPEVLCGTSLCLIQDGTRPSLSLVCLDMSAHSMCLDSNLKLLIGTFCLSWSDIFRTPGQLSFRKSAIWISPHISVPIYIQFKCLWQEHFPSGACFMSHHISSRTVSGQPMTSVIWRVSCLSRSAVSVGEGVLALIKSAAEASACCFETADIHSPAVFRGTIPSPTKFVSTLLNFLFSKCYPLNIYRSVVKVLFKEVVQYKTPLGVWMCMWCGHLTLFRCHAWLWSGSCSHKYAFLMAFDGLSIDSLTVFVLHCCYSAQSSAEVAGGYPAVT